MKYLYGLILLILLAVIAALYRYTSKMLSTLDRMIDSAIDDTFTEHTFTEKKLSKIESKMYRYLSSGNTSLRQINAEKDSIKTLISDISHQTKTPVSNILLYSQLLKESPCLDDSTRRLASQIEEQTEKLSFLTASLIKASRLENGIINVTPKENSIRKLVECVDCSDAADAKGIRWQIDPIPDCSAVFDFKWTLEAISNIVDNAVKYTPAGGAITISAREYEMFARIDIADTGIGMSEEETAKIFTRFYRRARRGDRTVSGA